MAKKIKILTCLIIIAVLVGACASIAVVNAKSVDAVKKVVMADNTSSSLSIEWDKVKKADGYFIYSFDEKKEEYEKLDDIQDGTICSYQLKDIEGGAVYKLKVTAYKYFNNNLYESEEAQTITAYALPSVMDIALSSPEEGILSIEWTEQKNASGYELEYSKNEDFSDSVKETLTEVGFKVEKLTPKDIYFVRARSFITLDDKNIYGEWSETGSIEIAEKIVMPADIDPNKPIVALSFDDGPAYAQDGKNSTEEILKVLEKYGARATFFMCGSRINNSNKKCLEKEIELGCELGNHTYDHSHYGKKVTANDIKKSSDAIKNASGQYPTIFRCPGGTMSSAIQQECKKEGLPIAYWSVDPQDWKYKNADTVYNFTIKHVYDGSIILMHDIYPSTADAVKKLVPQLIKEGYQIVTVSEMLTVKNGGKAPTPGQQYVDYDTINNNTK
ncbi:MAG: polysaccharide deacetylase family protein [Eubacterium sp.]|nr:polysaccharide deacetylase family protein [Eubacterium sp.]